MKAKVRSFFVLAGMATSLFFASCDEQPKTAAPVGSETPVEAEVGDVNGNPNGKNIRKKIFAKGKMRSGKEFKDYVLQAEYLLDSLGNEIEFTDHGDAFQTKIVTTRDAEGRELSKVRTGRDQTGKLEYRIVWNGDHTEQLEEEFSANEGRVVNKIRREYDTAGKLLSIKQEDLHIGEFPMEHTTNFKYDAKGNLIEETEFFGGKVVPGTKYTYSAKNECIRIDHFDSEGKLSQTNLNTYDKEGRLKQHELQDHGGYFKTPQLEARYEYDTKGLLAKEIHYKGNCTEAGQSSGDCPISETLTYTYDAEGRIATKRTERVTPSVVDMVEKYEYRRE